MLDAEYRITVVEEEILEKIETGIEEWNVDRSYANNLVMRIAEAVGISTEESELKTEIEFGLSGLKLFYYLTEDGDDRTFLEHVGQRCIETLLSIVKTSNNAEETAAAIGVLSNLPKDSQMTQWLLDAGALQVIFSCLSSSNASHKKRL
ncbi:uncharacterized protein LOC130766998 [Actinidia eriantha]|uniref:uncharacterized protein LOC130766998 n=1 Tax=Actinidia eriantha TaxID=165200 RepID=UPI00258BCA52|nr:uncharacterized protein LOC130766998 [Actinidia eriantha]